MDLAPKVVWPRITGFKSFSYTCSHGISPGVASLTIPVQRLQEVPRNANLLFGDTKNMVRLHDCLIDRWSFPTAGGEKTVTLSILDCRWRWQYGVVSGSFNERDNHGRTKPAFRKSPLDLLRYAFSRIPFKPQKLVIRGLNQPKDPNTWPAVVWRQENAARAFASLADQFGLRVVYQPVRNQVLLTPIGVGVAPPRRDWISRQDGATPQNYPNILTASTDENYRQVAFALEAVGLDVDGSVHPINDLTYCPEEGWSSVNPPVWARVVRRVGEERRLRRKNKLHKDDGAVRALAVESVYRWYRLTTQDPADFRKPLKVPGYGEVKSIDDVLLAQGILDHSLDEKTLTIHPPEVYGSYFYGGNAGGINSAQDQPILVPFVVDAERRLIRFDRPVCRVNNKGDSGGIIGYAKDGFKKADTSVATGSHNSALPVLLISARFRHRFTHEIQPAVSRLRLSKGTMEQVSHPPGLMYVEIAEYDNATWKVKQREDNLESFARHAMWAMRAKASEWEYKQTAGVSHAGTLFIDPDGLIHQVTWTVGGGTPIGTQYSLNSEHAWYQSSYPVRRQAEIAKGVFEELRESQLKIEQTAQNTKANGGL